MNAGLSVTYAFLKVRLIDDAPLWRQKVEKKKKTRARTHSHTHVHRVIAKSRGFVLPHLKPLNQFLSHYETLCPCLFRHHKLLSAAPGTTARFLDLTQGDILAYMHQKSQSTLQWQTDQWPTANSWMGRSARSLTHSACARGLAQHNRIDVDFPISGLLYSR